MDALEIGGQRAVALVTSTSVANTGALPVGVYRCIASVATSITTDRNTPEPALTTSNGLLITANAYADVRVGPGEAIYAIAGGAGTLSYIKIGN